MSIRFRGDLCEIGPEQLEENYHFDLQARRF